MGSAVDGFRKDMRDAGDCASSAEPFLLATFCQKLSYQSDAGLPDSAKLDSWRRGGRY
jgi:hypothetical protein